VDYLKP